MGMLPLAIFLREGGAVVEGWDDSLTPGTERILLDAGVVLRNPGTGKFECDFLVYSSAVRQDHPAFRNRGGGEKACLRRGELLARIGASRRLIAVAGSHGKTTTTAMIAWMARNGDLPIDWIIGGLPNGDFPSAANRGSDWLVAEIDESDGTIEGFYPEVTLFVNFDWDHADRYASREEMYGAWERLACRTSSALCYPGDDEALTSWSESVRREVFTPSPDGDFLATNAAAARMALRATGMSFREDDPMEGFPGVWRRQTVHLKTEGVAVVEDYAHHPAEVRALLSWIPRESFPEPLRIYFQPHRFTRTTRFAGEFVQALKQMDFVGLHAVYGAGEAAAGDPLQIIRSGLQREGVRVEEFRYLEDFEGFGGSGEPRGTYAFVGAGDANEWAPVLAALCRADSAVEALAELAVRQIGASFIQRYAPLKGLTTLKIGGNASLLAKPPSEAALRWLLRIAHLMAVPVAVVGNGSNLLVADEGFDGLVIHLEASVWDERYLAPDGGRIVASAGVSLPSLSRWAASRGLAGFEFMEGIPGTVGGGLRMNAGSMGGWMADIIDRVEGIDSKGRALSFSKTELDFGYRSCPRLEGICIIRAVFTSTRAEDPDGIRSRMRQYASRRRASQPGGASAGCLFRNPEGDSAGRLIDAAGLKGTRVGGVEVSRKHGNFVLPDRTATASDVVELMEKIRSTVAEKFGISLEPEVKFLGPGVRGAWTVPGRGPREAGA